MQEDKLTTVKSGNNRRHFLKKGLGLSMFAGLGYGLSSWSFSKGALQAAEKEKEFEVTKTDEEWSRILTPQQYAVLREHATERPFTSPLLKENREGTFHCAGCDQALYDSKTKYKSGTGWPSFYEALPDAVGTQEDRSFFMVRTEVHCSRCGGHLGHVFDDGPQPTGMRHCINGVAMTFKVKSA